MDEQKLHVKTLRLSIITKTNIRDEPAIIWHGYFTPALWFLAIWTAAGWCFIQLNAFFKNSSCCLLVPLPSLSPWLSLSLCPALSVFPCRSLFNSMRCIAARAAQSPASVTWFHWCIRTCSGPRSAHSAALREQMLSWTDVLVEGGGGTRSLAHNTHASDYTAKRTTTR